MNLVEIDASVCIGCGQCVLSCPYSLLKQREKGKPPVFDPSWNCLRCGHCVAVCPRGAIRHAELDPRGFGDISPSWNEAGIEMLLRSKRSIRRYLDKPVPREVIERLLATAAHAPSDTNTQDRSFLVLHTREAIDQFEEFIIQGFRFWMQKALGDGADARFRKVARTEELIGAYEAGAHPIFRGAPAVVCAYARADNVFGWYNCAVAMDYLMIQAHAAGLGSCITGVAMYAPDHASQFLRLPQGMRLYSVVALGYPRLKYRKTVPRKPANVQWR